MGDGFWSYPPPKTPPPPPPTTAPGKAPVSDANDNFGVLKVTGLDIGPSGSETPLTATAAELNVLHGVTPGITSARSAVVLGANKAVDSFNIITPGSALAAGTTYDSVYLPRAFLIEDGSIANPITTVKTPTVQISRIEALTTANGDNSDAAAVNINVRGYGSQQINGLKVLAVQLTPSGPTNDAVGLYGVGVQSGPANAGRCGYGGYFVGMATTAANYPVAVGNAVINNTGVDQPAGEPGFSSGFDNVSQGTNLVSYGMDTRYGGAQFDVGIGFLAGSVKTASIEDWSSSVSVLKDVGSHTNGIDLSGGTYSGFPLLVPAGHQIHCGPNGYSPAIAGRYGASIAANASLGLCTGNNALILYRDETVGGAALVFVEPGVTPNIIAQTGTNFTTTDPGAGGAKWFIEDAASHYGDVVNRYAVAHGISYLILNGSGLLTSV